MNSLMRGKRSSPQKPKNGGQETKNLENLEESHLSGAYIRSLVKQLSTSKTKRNPENLNNPAGKEPEEQEKPDENREKPHKKKVRRRAQTRKPYQEKNLNMAEARREIVTALKLHRAAMKRKASEKQPPGPEMEPAPETRQSCSGQEARLNSRRIYASTHPNFPVNNINANSTGLYSWPVSSFAQPLFVQEYLNLVQLPDKTLGLNLNLQDFNNLETTSFQFSPNNLSVYSSSSPSTSCSPAPSAVSDEITYVTGAPPREMMSGGWSDCLNSEISDGPAEFLEIKPYHQARSGFDVSSPFDDVMEFPAWMDANESCLESVNDFCGGGDNFHDPALSCMDIEEIEGMDWLA